METIVEALFAGKKFFPHRNQYLTVIENGISTIKDKCFQTHNNSLILNSKIQSDYNIIKGYKRRKNTLKVTNTPPFLIHKGIATWNNYDKIEELMARYDILVGITVTSFPELSGENMDLLITRLSEIKSISKNNKRANKLLQLVHKDELETFYDFLSIYDSQVETKDNAIRGDLCERILGYMVNQSRKEIDIVNTNILKNVSQNNHSIYNGVREYFYGFQYETDVILHTSNKMKMEKILLHIGDKEGVTVYLNPKISPLVAK